MSWFGGPQKPLLFPLLTITTPSIPSGQTGTPYSITLNAIQGTLPYAWSLILAPIWMSIGKATGTISGTPSVASSGTITVQVSDNYGSTAQVVYPLTIIANNPSVTTSSLPGATVGIPYSTTLAATGGTPPYTWSIVTGNAPGLTMASNGVYSGTPAASGNDPLLIQVADHLGLTGTANLTLAVAADGPSVTTTTLPATEIGVAYSQTLSATAGYPPYTWSAAISPNTGNAYSLSASGVLTGTGTTAETEDVVATVTDIYNQPGSKSLSLVVNTNPSITTASLPNATVGSPYSFTCSATGGIAPYTWSITSDTPDTGGWLSIGSSTGTLTGTPTTAEVESVTIKVVDSLSVPSAPSNLSLTVNAAATQDGYPLLYMISNGGTQNEDQGTATAGVTWVQMASRRHYSMVGWPPNWVGPSGGTPPSICSSVQSTSVMAVPSRVTNYYIIQTQYASEPSSLGTYFSNAKWWLYNAANSGGSIVTQGNGNVVNVTSAAPTFNSQTMTQYFAGWVTGVNFYGTVLSSPANPHMAGLFMDNYAGVAIATGFWNLTSSAGPGEPHPNQDVRTGQAGIVSAIRAAAPAGYIQTGNVADAINNNSANLTGLTGTLDVALMESQSGQSYSLDNLGWTAWVLPSTSRARSMCTGYVNGGPVWHADGITVSTGAEYAGKQRGDPEWQGIRYVFGAALVNGCYFCPTPSGNYNSNTQFNLDLMNKGKGLTSTSGYEYLGQPLTSALGAVATSTPWMTISGSPIWRRDFTNGIVLVRPAQANTPTVNTTSVTVTAAMLNNQTYHLFSSTQDSTYNGGTVTSWTFPRDRDSIILLNAPA